jgi:hypothetical protein
LWYHDENLWHWKLKSTPAAEMAARSQLFGPIPPQPSFHFSRTELTLRIKVPYWSAVLPAGILAAVLGIGHQYRFSLRTLLIATTLVAVGLAIIVL